MATGPWTPEEDEVLRRLIAQGVAQSEIGRQLDRTRGSVANRAAKLGVRSDRTQTAQATEAKVLDTKGRRAAAALDATTALEKVLAGMLQPLANSGKWSTIMKAEMGAEDTRELNFIPSRDLREVSGALSNLAGVIAKLDVGNDEHAEARAFITQLGEALLASAPETPPDTST